MKRWIIPLTAAAIIFGLMQMYPKQDESSIPDLIELKPSSIHQEMSGNIEHEQKLKILQKDMQNSDLLVLSEIEADLLKLIQFEDAKNAKKNMQHLQNEHPNYVYLKWEHNKSKVQLGNFPTPESEEARGYIKEADRYYIPGDHYSSKLFYGTDHHKYRIVTHVGEHVKVTAVVKASVIPQVEAHQKNNLRLIPFPAQKSNDEIETVKPNSTVDTVVITGEDNGNASHYFEHEVIVKFVVPPTENELQGYAAELNIVETKKIGDTYWFVSSDRTTEQLIAYFKENVQISFIEPHYIYITNEEASAQYIPNDSLFSRYQWNITNINGDTGWNISRGHEDVIIAVLDSGVQMNHPDLQNRLITGYNVNDNSNQPNDEMGHGTHVAGIIGASVNNNEGIAGLTWYNSIMPIKVLNQSGLGSTYSVAEGIIWATDQGAKVINLSLGNYASADFLHEAIKYAYERDVVLVAATGNDNTSRPGYPAAYPEVFAVGATTNTKQRAAFSNYGDYIDVVAPGDSIASTYIGGQYASLSGTSMATPHVSALAGLIRTVNPTLTNIEVMEIMRQTATDLGDAGYDQYFGYGEINVQAALDLAYGYAGTLQTYPQNVKNKLQTIINQ